jgi:hypothetical protein
MTRETIVAYVVLVGCGAVLGACSSSGSSGPCVDRSGTYAITFTPISGNCGAVGTVVDVITPGQGTSNSCTGSDTAPADNCTVTLSQWACPTSAGGTLVETGDAHWSEDGSTATGILEITVTLSDGLTCSGSYNVKYQRE